MLLRLASLLTLTSAAIVGIFHAPGEPSLCSLISIDTASGANETLAEVDICAGLSSTFPSFSSSSDSAIFVAISGASHAFAVAVPSGAATKLAPLANDPADDLVGAAFFPALGFFIVTQKGGVYNMSGDAPALFATVPAVVDAVVASAPSGGTGGAGRVFIADAASSNIVVLDMGAPAAAQKTLRGVAKPMDVAFDRESLYEVASYRLSALPVKGGAVRTITSLPDGPGFPSTYAFVAPGQFAFIDFNNTRIVDVATKAITVLDEPFRGGSRRVGMPAVF